MLLTLNFHPLLQPMTGVKSHKFDVQRLSDIKEALIVLFPKLRKYIRQISSGILKENLSLITTDDKIITRKDYYLDKIKESELTLVPIIAGANKVFTILLAVVLIAAAIYLGGAPLALGGGGFTASTATAGGLITAGGLLKMGIGLAISGLMQMFMSPPSPRSSTADNAVRRNNDMFDAMDNSTDSNTSIPLVYGMIRVAGQILSGHVESINHGQSDTIKVIDLLYKNSNEIRNPSNVNIAL